MFNTTLEDVTLESSFLFTDQIENHTIYYWRVQSKLGAEESIWSSVWRFETTDPFISMISPAGGEDLYLGATEVIRWETNISDTVSIDLLNDWKYYRSIAKVPGNIEAFAWQIPADLGTPFDYRIQIRSIADTTLSVTSMEVFNLIDTLTTSVHEYQGNAPDKFRLHQNYPNPFNPETIIEFEVPRSSFVELKVYAITGSLVATLVKRQMSAGRARVTFSAAGLASGIYFYTLESGDFKQIRKMMFLK